MLLGLAYHATYAWFPDVGPWSFVADASPVPALTVLTGLLHAFRMQVFFALSGFFSHLVFERRGARGFLIDRSRRLVLPFLFALPIVLGLDAALRQWSHAAGLMARSLVTERTNHATPEILDAWRKWYAEAVESVNRLR